MESTAGGILKAGKNSHFIYPTGKPRISRLGGISQAQPASPMPAPPWRGWRKFAVKYHSFTHDA